MATAFLWIASFQADPVRSLESATMADAAKIRAITEQQQRAEADQRRAFEQRFNHFIDALRTFNDAYNHSQGHVWPAESAEALRQAFWNVERTMPAPSRKSKRDRGRPASTPPAEPCTPRSPIIAVRLSL